MYIATIAVRYRPADLLILTFVRSYTVGVPFAVRVQFVRGCLQLFGVRNTLVVNVYRVSVGFGSVKTTSGVRHEAKRGSIDRQPTTGHQPVVKSEGSLFRPSGRMEEQAPRSLLRSKPSITSED